MVPYVSARGVLYQHHKGPYPFKNRVVFVAMTNRKGFIVNIVSNFVITHISVCPSNSWCLFQVPLFI